MNRRIKITPEMEAAFRADEAKIEAQALAFTMAVGDYQPRIVACALTLLAARMIAIYAPSDEFAEAMIENTNQSLANRVRALRLASLKPEGKPQ